MARVFCIPKAESLVVLMRTSDKTRGPGRIRTAVRTAYLIHAKILVVNVVMISQNIRFKAILSRSKTFSLLLWVANPLKL